MWPAASSPGVLPGSAGLQALQQASPQQLAMGAPPWVYTSAGWVQAGVGMGQPMLMPMAGMPGGLQQPMGSMAAAAGMPAGPTAVVPVDQAMFSGLAAGLSGLALQDAPSEHLSSGQGLSSAQGLACVPGMLPTSPTSGLLYQQSSGAYGIQAQAAVAGMPSPAAVQGSGGLMYAPAGGVAGGGASLQQQAAQQMVGAPISGGGGMAPDPRQQQPQWQ